MTRKQAAAMANIYLTIVVLYGLSIVGGFIVGGATIDITVDDWGETAPFDPASALITAMVAAISGLPMLLLFKALTILFEQRELHHGDTLWRLDQQTSVLTKALAPVTATEGASADGARQAATVVAVKTAKSGSLIDTLLADPEILEQAREIRRLYGAKVCASFLNRKAVEKGIEGETITDEDVPDKI